MDQSLTSSDKSVRSFLDARDRRQESLARIVGKGFPATVFLSLNIPGLDKTPSGSEALFLAILDQLVSSFPGLSLPEKSCDALGFYATMTLEIDPVAAKKRCIALETGNPSARLIDLDVYSAQGMQIDRASLGYPARTCLVCQSPAVDCIRLQRHSSVEVIARTHELLSPFTA